jgi:hypothetical protein
VLKKWARPSARPGKVDGRFLKIPRGGGTPLVSSWQLAGTDQSRLKSAMPDY